MIELDSAQEAAVTRALAVDGFAFLFEPRVGKTRTALAVVERRPDVRFMLVVAPKSVANVWETAIAEMMDTTSRPNITHLVVNFEWFNQPKNRKKFRNLCKLVPTMVIVDEAHRLKNRRSKQSRGVRTMTPYARYRLALTATSIEKGLENVWAIMDFVDQDIFGKFDSFKERFLRMGGFMGRQIIGYQNEEEFKDIFHQHMARIRLTDVSDRPIRTIRRIERLQQSPEGARLYRQLEKRLFAEHDGMRVETPLEITSVLRLQQLAGGWLCNSDERRLVDETKMHAAVAYAINSRPCVITCRYIHELDELALRLKKHRPLTVKGGEPLLTPRPEKDIVLVQTSAGVGIDLSYATTIIFYSWDYSFIKYEQMRFRILSRSQTTARYVFLMMRGTVDEAIYDAAVHKKKLSVAMHDYRRKQ